MQNDYTQKIRQGKRFMVIYGAVIIGLLAMYFGFIAINSLALETHKGAARVVSKEYKSPGQTYSTQIIGGVTRTIPKTTGELHIVHLNMAGKTTQALVSKDQYGQINSGDKIGVIYQKLRLTGAIKVLKVFGF